MTQNEKNDNLIEIEIDQPWIVYPGSTIQQNYAEDLEHGFIFWDIKSKENFRAKFIKLENEFPFITIKWENDHTIFLKNLINIKKRSRIRVLSDDIINQNDIHIIKKNLKDIVDPTEIIIKHSQKKKTDTSTIKILGDDFKKSDLRQPNILAQFLKEFNKDRSSFRLDDNDWLIIETNLKKYLFDILPDKNTTSTWEIKSLEFSNLFSYGKNNIINFDKINGICGILGANRIGKSSIVGSLLYCLFNQTDRGAIKNIEIVNSRKNFGEAKIKFAVDNQQYFVERITTKQQNKKGQQVSTTSVNLFKYDELNQLVDMNGEQRIETDKIIKELIGSHENFLLTSISTQSDINRFINEGSTQRKQIITSFLGLDIFDNLFEIVKNEHNANKLRLKEYGISKLEDQLKETEEKIQQEKQKLDITKQYINNGKLKLEEFSDALNKFDLKKQNELKELNINISNIIEKEKRLIDYKFNLDNSLINLKKEYDKIEELQNSYDEETKNKFDEMVLLSNKIFDVKKQVQILENNKIKKSDSIKILNDIPCGDNFPECKFIKNAYNDKKTLNNDIDVLSVLNENLGLLQKEYTEYEPEKLKQKISNAKQISESKTKIVSQISKYESDLLNIKNNLVTIEENKNELILKKEKIIKEFDNKSEDEIEILFNRIDDLNNKKNKIVEILNEKEKEHLSHNVSIGIFEERKNNINNTIIEYNKVSDQLRISEFMFQAFSKKGIPAKIISEQLPLINFEISNILQGVVDFTIELILDDDSNSLDIFINYGDKRRIIELCSGMEKFISSLAIRVALTNISTLPKTNIFIIDEGFGSLDDQGVEACNRLLVSLKKYFKSIFVITHVDSVKEIVDHIIDITKDGLDSHVSIS